MAKLITLALTTLFLIAFTYGLNFCGDWTQYKGIKCFKVLDRKDTADRALDECRKLDNSSYLVTIPDQEQQNFVNEMVKNSSSNTSMFAWIGMKWNNKTYQWVDGSDSEFTNWSDEAVRSGDYPCVKISLMSGMLGKWMDSSCNRRALVVCQRKPELTLNSLKDIIQNMSNVIENNHAQTLLNIESVKNSVIPLGFLYTQLPNQTSPQQLWPKLNWTEVTKEYAGLFFRAEGQGSALFGHIQQANQSIISGFKTQGFNYRSGSTGKSTETIRTVLPGIWNNYRENYGFYSFGFHLTKSEVRPINTAVKIWKRTG